jgi:hypothetical protein
MKYIVGLLLFEPLAAFLIAGAIELRSGASRTQKVLSLVPVAFGILVYGLLWVPTYLGPSAMRWLTFFCLIIACSVSLISFSRRSSSILVVSAALINMYVAIFFPKPLV